MRKYIFIAVSLLAILSCVKESVAPEQRITGIFALDDGSGLSDEYIEFKNGYLTTYSLLKQKKQKTFAEGKFWNASKNDFYADVAWRYSIIEDDLKADGKSRGKISISEDALKIGESTYTRVKGFESGNYSAIKPERTIVSVPYVQTTDTVACSISRPIPAGTARVKSKPAFVSSASFDGENLIFTVDQTKTDRSGKIVLTYTNAEDVEIEVKQEPQTFIVLQPTSAEVSYQAGTGQFSFSIENPVEGELLSVQTYQNWVHDLAVDGNLVSFSYDENNSKSSRTASIICSYPGAKDVMFTLTQRYSAPTINTDPASTTATYSGGSYSIDCTIDNPREAAFLTATTTSSWITGIKVENGKVSFNVAENNSSAQRSGTIRLSYGISGTTYATKNYTVVQTYSSSAISVSPESTTATYAGGSFSINCVIDNPREAAVLTATTTSSWITGIKVENGKVSFNVAENNSSAQRSGTIKFSYGISETTYATKDYPIVQNGAPVTSLTLNKTSLAMNAGTSETLVATVTPSDATLVWSSSNTSVATVDGNGKVTAKANGTTTIAVKGTEGSVQATCSVTVTTAVTSVSLNKTTLSLSVGSSETLVATVAPSTASNKTVTWSSNNTTVATVDGNGKVTANANGTATITVKTADGSKTATCSVTVTTAVTGVSLSKTTLSLNAGSSETLVATIAPSTASNKNATWYSSNTSVATVDSNGKVTAKANGTATITVKTVDGSKTATCSVTVTTAVTGVSLNKTTLSLNVGSSETLVPTISPSTASNKEVTWSSSNTGVATVDGNGKVTANASGAATITVKTVDGSKTATCAVSVNGDAFINYMFNYNAKEFISSTHTIPKKTGQSFNVDIVMSANPTIYTDHLHFSGNSKTTFGYLFPNSASNPFNRTDTNCEFTFIWKSSTSNSQRMIANRSGRGSEFYDYNWWLNGGNDFQNFNDYSGVTRTSPAISSFVVNFQNIGLQKDYTNNLTSGPKSVVWDNQNRLPDGIAFFKGYAASTWNNSESWTGDFYWMYCATRTLSDIEIQQVIDYNENL